MKRSASFLLALLPLFSWACTSPAPNREGTHLVNKQDTRKDSSAIRLHNKLSPAKLPPLPPSPHHLRVEGPFRPHEPISLQVGFVRSVPALPIIFRILEPLDFVRRMRHDRAGLGTTRGLAASVGQALKLSPQSQLPGEDLQLDRTDALSGPELTLISILPHLKGRPGTVGQAIHPAGVLPGLYLWAVLGDSHITFAPFWVTGNTVRTSREGGSLQAIITGPSDQGLSGARGYLVRNGQLLGEASSDPNGSLLFPGVDGLEVGILVEHKNGPVWLWAPPAPPPPPPLRIYLRAIPGRVAPGDPVEVIVLVRPLDRAAGLRLPFSVVGASGNILHTTRISLDEYGAARVRLEIPLNAKSGPCSLQALHKTRLHRGTLWIEHIAHLSSGSKAGPIVQTPPPTDSSGPIRQLVTEEPSACLLAPRSDLFFSQETHPPPTRSSGSRPTVGRSQPLLHRYARILRRRLDALTVQMVVALQNGKHRSAAWMAEEVLRHDPDHDTALHISREARRALGVQRAPGTGIVLARTPKERVEKKLSIELLGLGLPATLRALEHDVRVRIEVDRALLDESDFNSSRTRFQTLGETARRVLDRLATDHNLAYRFLHGTVVVSRPERISRLDVEDRPTSTRLPDPLRIELPGSPPIVLQPVFPPLPRSTLLLRELDAPRTRSEILLHKNGQIEEKRTLLPPRHGVTLSLRVPPRLRRGDQVYCPVSLFPVQPVVGPLASEHQPSTVGKFPLQTLTKSALLLSGDGPQAIRLGPIEWSVPIHPLQMDPGRQEVVSGTVRPGGTRSFLSERKPDRVHELRVYAAPVSFLPELLNSMVQTRNAGPFSTLYRRIGPFLALEWARDRAKGTGPWLSKAVQLAMSSRAGTWPSPTPNGGWGQAGSLHDDSSTTASILEEILRARESGLAVPDFLIDQALDRAVEFLDSKEVSRPAIRWGLLLDLVLGARAGVAERCLDELVSTDFDTAGAHTLATALEACSRLGMQAEKAALLQRLVAMARPARGGLAWGREGVPSWEMNSFAATARAVAVLAGHGPEPMALARRGFDYLVALRTRQPGWGSPRRTGAVLHALFALPIPEQSEVAKRRVLRLGDRVLEVAGGLAPRTILLDDWKPPARRIPVALLEGSRPQFLSIVYQPHPEIPTGVRTLRRTFHPQIEPGSHRVLVVVESPPHVLSGRFRLEESLPAGARLLAVGPGTAKDLQTLCIRPDATFSIILSIEKETRPVLAYLLELPLAGQYTIPEGQLTPLDHPEPVAVITESTLEIEPKSATR